VISITTDRYDDARVEFAYDAKAVDIVRTIHGRHWDPETRHCTIPPRWVNLAAWRFTDAGFPVLVDGRPWNGHTEALRDLYAKKRYRRIADGEQLGLPVVEDTPPSRKPTSRERYREVMGRDPLHSEEDARRLNQKPRRTRGRASCPPGRTHVFHRDSTTALTESPTDETLIETCGRCAPTVVPRLQGDRGQLVKRKDGRISSKICRSWASSFAVEAR
jgi:hypothetical protein